MRGNTNATSGGGIKILNVVETGSLTRNGAIYSGFSSSDYLQLGDKVENGYVSINNNVKDFGIMTASADRWKMIMKFKYKSVGQSQYLFSNRVDWGSNIAIQSNGIIYWQFSNSNSSSDITGDQNGTTTLIDDTIYWIKVEFTGTAYQLSLSTDGVNYSVEGQSISSVTKVQSRGNGWVIGYYLGLGGSFQGDIYIDDWSIEANNSIWWKGAEIL